VSSAPHSPFSAAAFLAGLNSPAADSATRVSWKYIVSRGISGTPNFLVNGVAVDADPDWGLSEWKKLIQPLLRAGEQKKKKSRHGKKSDLLEMSADEQLADPVVAAQEEQEWMEEMKVSEEHQRMCGRLQACMFLPNRVDCCGAEEMCVPNVGCRM